MGPRLKLPPYIHGYTDRHGRPRFYFRRAGFKKVPLPGLPWSPVFMDAYDTALAGQRIAIGASPGLSLQVGAGRSEKQRCHHDNPN